MISAVIITKDEAQRIASCIKSVVNVVDEIVIIDAESTDDTVPIAKQTSDKVKVIIKPWTGYGSARNCGADQALYNNILSIDADECIDDTLAQSIAALKADPSILSTDGVFAMKRVNVYRGKKMKVGMLAPEKKPRLYPKSVCIWDNSHVHERLRYRKSNDPVQYTHLLSGELIHHTYDDIVSHRTKMKHYATLAAQQWYSDGRRPTRVEAMIAPQYHFLRNYIIKKGCIDRSYGWETSMTAMLYHREKYHQYGLLRQQG